MANWRIVSRRIERVIAWLLVYNRAISWLLVVGALILCLYRVVPGWPVWAWCSLAVAVIFVFEMGFCLQRRNKKRLQESAARVQDLRGDPNAPRRAQFDLEAARVESEQLRRDTSQSLLGVSLLLASAFGLVLAVHSKPATSTGYNQTSIHLSDRTENHLPTDGKTSAPGSNETTIGFHHDLEQALSDYLKKPPSPDHGISWPLAVLIGVVAVVVGWIVTHRPSAAPVVGAGGVAEEVVRKLDLSRSDGNPSWVLIYLFFLVGTSLLAAGVVQVYCRCKADEGSIATGSTKGTLDEKGIKKLWKRIKAFFKGRPEASSEGSLLTVGFSVLVLAWAMLLVAERPQVSPLRPSHYTSQIVAGPPSPSQLVPAPDFPLSSVEFAKGSGTVTDIRELKTNLSGKVETGDMLLLIGSADCAPIKKPLDNYIVASNRASEVLKALKKEHQGLEIQTIVLPQYSDCKETPSLRAVFPYLIRSKSTER